MNRKNFFKVILGVLAMPSAIYAKVFNPFDGISVSGFNVNERSFKQFEAFNTGDLKVGQIVLYKHDVYSISKIPDGQFIHNGQHCYNYFLNKFYAKKLLTGEEILFCMDVRLGHKDADFKFYA